MTTQEIRQVVREYLQTLEDPTIADFVNTHVNFIVQNTPSIKLIDKFWPSVIHDEAKKLKKNLTKSRVQWKRIFGTARLPVTLPIDSNNNITFSETLNNNSNATASSTKPTTSSSSGKRSRSSSAKTDSYKMTPDMKEEYKRAFEELDDDKKWCLDDGTRVEDVIYAYGEKCDYEHLAHSFILDTEDKC
ncbi:hypothetical protein BDC45DRAFT_607635 [Circinella umbellata]|nr:hypothetical protein BDC45DRAFT_607635 [Circinella umbellata]